MKKSLFLCLPFLAALPVLHSCGTSTGGSGIRDIVTNENTEADLGTVYEKDGPVQVNLIVSNSSADTLKPLAAYTRCQCLSASVARTPVPPGDSLKLEVTYNPAYKKGIFMEEISVRLLEHNSLSFIVKGEVIPMEHPIEEDHPYDFGCGLHLSHEVLHYGKMSGGESRDIFIRYANGTGKKMDIGFITDSSWTGAVVSRRGIVLPGKGRDTLHFRFTMPDCIPEGDTLKISVRPYVNGKKSGKDLIVKAISRGQGNGII